MALQRVVAVLLATSAAFAAGNVGPMPARAHSRSQSYSTWTVADGGDVRLSFSVAAREVTRLAAVYGDRIGLNELMATHLARQVVVRLAGEICPPVGGPRALAARAGHVRVEWRFECPSAVAPDSRAELEISVACFFDVVPSHLHFARVAVAGGSTQEYLFSDGERTRVIARGAVHLPGSAGSAGSVLGTSGRAGAALTFGSYVTLGAEHILSGADHLAFLLALLLLTRRAREVALLVTGFTLGHSVTLSLATLAVLQPDIGLVESLIGFTIALVAAEAVGVATGASTRIGALGAAALAGLALLSLWRGVGPPASVLAGLALFTFCYLRLTRTRELAVLLSPALSILFGFVHGFGFASVLMEIGLPSDRLVPALFGFNVGVELGQLAIVALILCAGAFLSASVARKPRTTGHLQTVTQAVAWHPARHPARVAQGLRVGGLQLGREVVSAALCGLGLFWFVSRAYVS